MPADVTPGAPALPMRTPVRAEPPWRGTWRAFTANRAAIVGLAGLILIVVAGLLGPALVDANPFEMMRAPLMPPGEGGVLGSDYLGRDVFVSLVHGARTTLLIALAATGFTVLIGLLVGALAGYYGGIVDDALMRFTEFFQVLPNLIFAMVLTTLFSSSLWTVIFAIGVVNWCPLARLTRAEVLRLKGQEYVMAARAAGARDGGIILRTILPNAMPPLVISITLLVGICILFEAAMSFLGLTDPDVMTWGLMIGISRDYFWEAWWTVTFPGLAILITVLCIALIGDGLNDALNPKLRKR